MKATRRLFLQVLLPILLWQVGRNSIVDAACPVCKSGTAISLPEKEISIPGYEFIQNCAAMEGIAAALFSLESPECKVIQSAGSLCGCPILLSNACYLCGNDDDDDGEMATEATNKQATVNYALPEFGDFLPTCELAEAYLHSLEDSSETCLEVKDVAEETCCVAPVGNATITTELDDPPGTSTVPREYCSLCNNNDTIARPEKDITNFILDVGFGVLFENPKNITCGDAEVILTTSLSRDSSLCYNMEWSKALKGLCGCPLPDNTRSCIFECRGSDADGNVPWPDVFPASGVLEYYNVPIRPTCGDFQSLSEHYDYESGICHGVRFYNHLCGCNGGKRSYLGADTDRQQAGLAWAPRITGSLSLMGSLLIIRDVSKDRNKRNSVHHQLVFSMATFDIFNSVSWIFSTALIPVTEYGIDSGFYGAIGNDATCTAQGFFVQLGYTGIFYNLVLSVYYVLVIKYGLRESRLKQLRKYFHTPPLLVGFTLAFAGIPFYKNAFMHCHIQPPPLDPDGWGKIFIFSVLPISIVIVVTMTNMLVIYVHVRKQDQAANRWRIGVRASAGTTDGSSMGLSRLMASIKQGFSRSLQQQSTTSAPTRTRPAAGNNRLSNAVFWQALLYLVAFLLTWPIYFFGNFRATGDDYAFWLVLVTLNPLQGSWNALVYFRVRLVKSWGKMNKRLADWYTRQKEKKNVHNTLGVTPPSSMPREESHDSKRMSQQGSLVAGNLVAVDELDNLDPTEADSSHREEAYAEQGRVLEDWLPNT